LLLKCIAIRENQSSVYEKLKNFPSSQEINTIAFGSPTSASNGCIDTTAPFQHHRYICFSKQSVTYNGLEWVFLYEAQKKYAEILTTN